MASPNTPLLDAQILKLRRLLGDITNEDGTAIDATNVYSSTSGVTWKQLELIDIYNDAIRRFMSYMIEQFPIGEWWEFMPGYVTYSPSVSVSDDKVLLDDLDPTSFQMIDVKRNSSSGVPSAPTITLTGTGAGGTLTGEKYYKVSGVNSSGEGVASAEAHVSCEGTVSIALEWTGDADYFRVYRGDSAGVETVFFITSGHRFTDVGDAGQEGTPAVRPLSNSVDDLAVFVPPNQWFATKAGLIKTRKPDEAHVFYTILAVNSGGGEINSAMILAPTGIATVDLIYLRDHMDWIQDSADRGDLWGISQDGLNRVIVFAETIARRWKSTEAADVPEASLQQMMQLDANRKKEQ